MSGAIVQAAALPADGGALHGTLVIPRVQAEARPCVLFHAGSGPTDRDGNTLRFGVKSGCLRLMAEGLAARGIASLRADKRGIGESWLPGQSEKNFTIQTYVSDALRWFGFLQAHPLIGGISLAGHSEGALILTLAAQSCAARSIALIAGAGRPAGKIIREQLKPFNLPQAAAASAESILKDLEAGRTPVSPVPDGLAAMLRPGLHNYLRSWLNIDPAKELAKLSIPALAVQGGNDLQVSLDDARLLSDAKPGIRSLIIPAMNHVLKDAPLDRAGNIAAYFDPALPLSRDLVPALADFFLGA